MIALDKNVGGFLKEAFAENHAVHAYVVEGDRQQLPQLLRQCALVCLCRSHTGEDFCQACKKVEEGVNQDVITLPTDTVKNLLTVKDVEFLVEESYKCPIDAKNTCRVFLIDASNSLAGISTTAWQNKLLKTLEEPTENVYIFIGVADAEGLLPTIRSRCQILKQTKLSPQQVRENLQRRYEKKFAEVAACACNGSQETAESILANPAIMSAFETAVDLLENMTSTKNAVKYASAIVSQRDSVGWVFTYLTVLLRESIVYRLAEELCLLPSYQQTVEKICKNYSLQAAEVCIELINGAKKRLDDGGNATLIVDQLTSAILEVKFRCRI